MSGYSNVVLKRNELKLGKQLRIKTNSNPEIIHNPGLVVFETVNGTCSFSANFLKSLPKRCTDATFKQKLPNSPVVSTKQCYHTAKHFNSPVKTLATKQYF